MGRGTNVNSAQFLFDPDEFAYIKQELVFSITISVSPALPVFPTLGKIGGLDHRTDCTGRFAARFCQHAEKTNPTRHSI